MGEGTGVGLGHGFSGSSGEGQGVGTAVGEGVGVITGANAAALTSVLISQNVVPTAIEAITTIGSISILARSDLIVNLLVFGFVSLRTPVRQWPFL